MGKREKIRLERRSRKKAQGSVWCVKRYMRKKNNRYYNVSFKVIVTNSGGLKYKDI